MLKVAFRFLFCGVSLMILGGGLFLLAVWPRPTRDQATLKAIAAESRLLVSTHSIDPPMGWTTVPKSQWPPTIAALRPHTVRTSSRGRTKISVKPYFDGGWGYEIAESKRQLGMLPECYSELGHGVYWHGPC